MRLLAAIGGAIGLLSALSAPAAELIPFAFSQPADQPRSSVGLQLRARALELSGDVTAHVVGSRTQVAPKLFTKFTLAPKVSMESRLDFAEWNGRSALLDAPALEMKFRATTPVPLVREVESLFHRSPDGHLRRRLGIRLAENLGLAVADDNSMKLNMHAVWEQTIRDDDVDRVVVGVRASLTGFATISGASDSKLSVRYEARQGTQNTRTGVLTYHTAWTINDFLRLSVDCQFVSALESESTIKFGWTGAFR